MEELRSTEVLDQEILEDARRKAGRILKQAEQSFAALEANWSAKTEADLLALKASYDHKTAGHRAEVKARLPLEKRRLRVERANDLLGSALYDYFSGLSEQQLISILGAELQQRRPALGSTVIKVQVRGLSDPALKSLLAEHFPGQQLKIERLAATRLDSSGHYPQLKAQDQPPLASLVFESQSCRVRISLAELAEGLLRDQRAELAIALLGEEVLRD